MPELNAPPPPPPPLPKPKSAPPAPPPPPPPQACTSIFVALSGTVNVPLDVNVCVVCADAVEVSIIMKKTNRSFERESNIFHNFFSCFNANRTANNKGTNATKFRNHTFDGMAEIASNKPELTGSTSQLNIFFNPLFILFCKMHQQNCFSLFLCVQICHTTTKHLCAKLTMINSLLNNLFTMFGLNFPLSVMPQI